jgi:uncharacterized protein DUF5667
MTNSYDILETCLQEVENGMDPEAVLARYPDLADELRPILKTSLNARQMGVVAPSSEILLRNRAKLLQHAAHLREAQPLTMSKWLPSFQRLAVALVLLVVFFVSGTSLVRASASALPGDSLYSVKRSWEGVTLFFTFDEKARDSLQVEYENERLEEIRGLFASGRPAKVDFAGIITRQDEDGWRVANVVVVISSQTDLPNQPVQIGMALRVMGTTEGAGIVLAEQIELLPPGAALPEVADEQPEVEAEEPQATPQPNNGGPGSGSSTETPEIEVTATLSPVATPRIESFEGILNSINDEVWMINDILVNVAIAEIKGIPVIGASVKAEGYYELHGVFIATKIEIIDHGSSSEDVNSNNNDDGGANANGNDNGDDNRNSNDNNNDSSNHNSNDDSGNGENSNNDNGSSGSGGD